MCRVVYCFDLRFRNIMSIVFCRAPRFRGWAQQDAHELLRYLLDGLRTEELNRHKEAISKYVKATKNNNPRLTDDELSLLAKVKSLSDMSLLPGPFWFGEGIPAAGLENTCSVLQVRLKNVNCLSIRVLFYSFSLLF